MDNLLTVAFEAHHGYKNHHRRYEVTVGRDLFYDWTVAVRYGRIGQRCQERRYVSPKPKGSGRSYAIGFAGVRRPPGGWAAPYRLAAFSHATGFDATDWLPNDVMAGFFVATVEGSQPKIVS
jgi:hypothetical protein